jgi:lactate dehydrogenase-like 2-hydroxyacid dehydrogenase
MLMLSLPRPQIDERLRRNCKITILPHVGTHTYESRYEMELLVLQVCPVSSIQTDRSPRLPR